MTNGTPRRLTLTPLRAAMAGAGGKSMGAYDYLIKLMLIGDSGVSRRTQDQASHNAQSGEIPALFCGAESLGIAE